MYRTFHSLILLYTVFFCLFIAKQTIAEEAASSEAVLSTTVKTESINPESINQNGFILDFQKIDPVLLAENVEKLRDNYIRHQLELAQQVEKKKLNVGDVVISIIIPGGLFYAGYRKQELEKAKSVLLAVTNEIRELSNDLMALKGQDTSHPLIMAQLPRL